MEDITKTGPVGLKGLKGLSKVNSMNEKELEEYLGSFSTPNMKNIILENAPTLTNDKEINTGINLGESIWDKNIYNQEEIENASDVRAENQPWYAKIGAGLAKGAILAGTTFLDGTVGLLFGAGTAIGENRTSGLWDNDFSKAMQSINEWSEQALPNYYTKAEQEQPWYENVFTANFLGDKFIKNLGFTVGAFYSGGLTAAGLKATKLPQIIGAVAKSSKAPAIVNSAVGATISAVNEGRIEALNNSKDWFELHKTQLDDEYRNRLQTIKDIYGDTEVYSQLVAREQSAYNEALEKLTEDRLKMGNADLLMNIPILTASNIIQFGKLYANGFKTARKANNIVGRAGEYTAGSTKLGATMAITKGALSEGTEEIAQSMASRISGDYYSTDVNNFYKAKTDREASQETLDWTKAVAEGINETVNDGSSWEEFFIGSLTGALGMPRFRSIRNNEGRLQSPVTLEGGIKGEINEYREKTAREKRIADYMNSRVNSPEFKNYYQGLIRHNKYQNDMNNSAEDGDEFNFKNAEHAQLVSDIAMFDNAGKLEDLKTLVSSAFDTSDENLASIVENTTSILDNGDLVGPFAQYAIKNNDGTISANFGNEESKQEMISKLTQNKDDMINTIKQYQTIKDDIDIKTGQQLSDEQLEELTWMKSQLNNWADRSVEMSKDIKDSIGKILGNLHALLNYNINIKNQEGASNIERTEKYDKANTNILNLQHNIKVLENVRNSSDEELAFLLTTNPKFIEDLKREIGDVDSSIMDEDNKQDIKIKLNDINKLGNASKLYREKLNDYLLNPSRQVEEHSRINTKTEENAKKEEIDNMSTPDIVESMESGDLDFSGMDLNFDQSDLDILNGKKPDATEEEIKNSERKAKVKNAKDIINTKERAKEQAKELTKDSSQYDEIAAMLDEASKVSNTPEELLDFDTEVFNNPSKLITTPEEEDMAKTLQTEGYNPQEIAEALLESKNQRNDELKGILQQIKDNINRENGELESLPKPNDPNNIVVREFGDTKSVDSTGAGEVVNNNDTKYNKDTDAVTPDISNIEVLDDTQSININDTNEIKGYWKPNTTELPIHRDSDNNDPYYTRIKDPVTKSLYKTIYDFLYSNNVFSRINNNEIKRNQKVRFAFSKTLTNNINKAIARDIPVLLIIDENNNIIGDLANPYDINTFNSFEGLSELYKEAIIYAKEHSNDSTDDLIIIPNVESTINRNYIGRPRFAADADSKNTLNSLNTIADGKPFKLSIALTSSPNPTMIMEPGRRKIQGLTDEEMKIIPSATAKAGQPFLLIETSDERRKYYPVPVIMPLLSSSNRDSTIYKKVKSLVSTLLDANVTSNSDSLLKLKDKLRELIAVSDLYIETTDNNGVPNITIRVKRLSTDTSWDSVYKGPLDIDNIMEGFENANISYQVSRKYINSTFDGISYNNMIGEIAETNLETGALHTVNDFFTINPIIKGKQEKAKPIKDAERIVEDAIKSKNRKSAVNFVEKVIIPNQSKVDKTKTDKDYYYIKEDDGKYHKYERVHRILPSNFSGTSKYGDRALIIGSAIDTVVRDYFNTGKTIKPDNLSDVAYKALTDYLNTLNKWIKDNGYTVFANNIVLHHKYPDGRRIAGEVDLLLVDNNGNYLIYDIKTSAYSFYSPTFDNVQPQWGQQMSTKDYYSNQLSSYVTLLRDEYGKNTSKIALIPFVLGYDSNNPMQVISLVHENNKILPIKDVTIYFNQATSDSGTSAMDEFEKALAGLEGNSNRMDNLRSKLDSILEESIPLPLESDKNYSVDISTALGLRDRIKSGKKGLTKLGDGTYKDINWYINEIERLKKEIKNARGIRSRRVSETEGMLGQDEALRGPDSFIALYTKSIRNYLAEAYYLLNNNVTSYAELEDNKSNNTSSNQRSSTISTTLSREESLQRIKSTKLFRTPQRKALLDKLEDSVLSDIATMKEPILKAKLSKVDALIKPNMSKEDLNTLVKNTLTSTLNRDKNSDIESKDTDISKEIERTRKILPQLSKDEAIVLVDSIIKTPTSYAWGQFKNGVITLYKNAAKGTAYHEAFHYVFNTLMNNNEIEESYNAARQQWGNLDAIELEERMAEDFREYMQNEETFTGRLKNIWRRFKNFIDKLRGKEHYLDSLYHNISKGNYSNINSNIDNNSKYRELTKEDIQRITDNRVNNSMINKTRVAKNNSWGKLKDSLIEQGYIIKGYYDKVKGGYIVTSTTLNPSVKQANDIRYYHINKLKYNNLTEEQKNYLAERKIPLSVFNNMTLEEKEILFECMS